MLWQAYLELVEALLRALIELNKEGVLSNSLTIKGS